MDNKIIWIARDRDGEELDAYFSGKPEKSEGDDFWIISDNDNDGPFGIKGSVKLREDLFPEVGYDEPMAITEKEFIEKVFGTKRRHRKDALELAIKLSGSLSLGGEMADSVLEVARKFEKYLEEDEDSDI